MSVEAISLLLVAAGVLITLGGGLVAGLTWLLRRIDELSNTVADRFDKMDEQINSVRSEISSVRSELNEVKVAVARLEGPQPRLIYPR